MKTKKIYFAALAIMLVAACAFSVKKVISMNRNPLFEANVESLMRYELMPGEEENCEEHGEKCLYSYGGKNYHIETKKTKEKQ